MLLQEDGIFEKQAAYRFASVLNSGICILRHTEELTILHANEACYNVYGYTPEQFEKEKLNSPVSLIYDQDRQMAEEKLEECMAAGERYLTFEMRNFCRDGSMIWVEARITVVHQEDTDILVCLLWDISEKNVWKESFRFISSAIRLHWLNAATPYGNTTWMKTGPIWKKRHRRHLKVPLLLSISAVRHFPEGL